MGEAHPLREALWVFLPLTGSFLAHAPVLRFGLLQPLARPLDGGATLRGRRIFGENKTWRGALTMGAGVVLMTLVLSRLPEYWSKLPLPIQRSGPLLFGCLLGLGTVLGELPNSFLKRQLDIPPGAQRRSIAGTALSILDQGDFVPGVWLLLSPIWLMSPAQAAAAFLLVVVVHLAFNRIGYAIGARKGVL